MRCILKRVNAAEVERTSTTIRLILKMIKKEKEDALAKLEKERAEADERKRLENQML